MRHRRGTRDLLADNVLEAMEQSELTESAEQVMLRGIDVTLSQLKEDSRYRPWLTRYRDRLTELMRRRKTRC